ncbi:MAG: AsmA-like C-terminal region-containing protein [Muribaculaceae bacterium]|nr:AsmA-like C-terminal region-containing protein [Muribaculaceae bacterium]
MDFIRSWKAHLGLKAFSGTILTPALPLHNGFSDLDLEASFDSVKLNSLKFNSQDTRLSARGKLSNLRQFLTSGTVAPVKGEISINIDTVRINQLCGAYNHGLRLTHGPEASVLTVIPDTLTPSDTVALLLPRNIIADIKISAMMTEYTNLYLHNLTTDISLRDGKLDISNLGVDSDFGTLNMDFRYDTSDIQRLAMKLDMNLSDVRLVEFFRNFHTLLLMMPQMKNLRGDLSAKAKARLLLFPDMYLKMPSLWADIYVRGDNMVLHQDQFIRHLTRMMLIHGTDDIALSDLDIHASIHDNLMELYPFGIDFDRYRLSFGGLNNFDGDMYYHLGIEKSPIPFPFGINIKGNLSHPEIRFGGATFKIDKGEEITSSIMEEKRLNLLLVLKRLVREMIEKAAEADSTPASNYVFR